MRGTSWDPNKNALPTINGLLMGILLTLLSRLLTVGVPIAVLGQRLRLPEGAWSVLTCGGLRGGISVAWALSLPPGAARDVVVSLTYLVLVFSVLIQGMSIGKLVKRVISCAAAKDEG